MPSRRDLLSQASRLRHLAVRNYAESRHWSPVTGIKGRLWVFRHSEQHLRQLIIPMDADADGFQEAMLGVAERVAEMEHRDLLSVLADLQHPDADILRFRVVTPETEAGDLPLVEDVSLREGARKALLAAASTVLRPARHHPRMSRTQAEQFVNSCRVGQAQQGSYVFQIVCPLHSAQQLPLFGQALPFAREVTSLLLDATSRLIQAIEDDRVARFLEQNAINPVISSNLCDALLRMQPSTATGKVELSATWAALPGIPPPKDVPGQVSIPLEYFPEIEGVYLQLRPAAETDVEEMLLGTVETLNGVVGDNNRRQGEVVLSLLDREGEPIRARVNLDADQYAEALRAHEEGSRFVVLFGILRRGVRVGRVDQIHLFRRLREEDVGLRRK